MSHTGPVVGELHCGTNKKPPEGGFLIAVLNVVLTILQHARYTALGAALERSDFFI